MATTTTRQSAFADIIESTNSDYGPDASRKAMLADCEVPLHVLDTLGVDVPHREYIDDASDAREFPHTLELPDGSRVHLHQDVREQTTEAFGDFGSIDTSEEDIIWTVTDLTEDTVTLKVVGDWGKSRHVPAEEFCEEYEPLYLADGQPKWGY